MSLDVMQHLLLEALLADDPQATLQRLLSDTTIAPDVRAALERVDEDGLQLASLLIRKLRFERLTRSVPDLAAMFLSYPVAFAAHFIAYTNAVPPGAYFPDEEARLYREWWHANWEE
jgi:hypothetical protein